MKKFITLTGAVILWMLIAPAAVITADEINPPQTLSERNLIMASDDEKATVIENLQHAFNGESNASAKYAVYAEKAKADGYLAVSALFSAASAAEKLHASRHAAVLKAAGVEAKADIGTYAGKDIREMLQDAIAGETEEFTEMYPGFIKTAQAAGYRAAVKSFRDAMEAEKVHAKLYTDALNDLEDWKAEKSFFVCPICGWTEAGEASDSCPLCSTPGSKFLEFK